MAICTSGPQHRQANAQIGRAESIVTVGGSGIVAIEESLEEG